MRVTQNSIMRQYNDRLSGALTKMNNAGARVATGLKYLRSYESPADASKAARLYDQKLSNERYITNIKDTISVFDGMEDNMRDILSTLSDASSVVETALNSPMSSERSTLADILRGYQKTIVSNLNAKLSGQNLFGGSGSVDQSFSLSDDGKTLLYRGLDVSDPANQAALDDLSKEGIYVDVGFGLTYDSNNKLVPGTAFNKALPGISFTGYGTDASGDSKNVVLTLGAIADALDDPNFDGAKVGKLWDDLKGQYDNVNINISKLGVNYNFIQSQQTRLESEQDRLEQKLNDTIGIDPAAAITDWTYQQYVYNAILKMGTSILSPSFIDYMK